MVNKTTKYALRPHSRFPVSEGINYVIDLPEMEEVDTVVVVQLSWGRLEEKDMIRLPSGSWLEVSLDKDCCFGYDGRNYAILEIQGMYLVEPNRNPCDKNDNSLFFRDYKDVAREISIRRKENRVYPTLATLIR